MIGSRFSRALRRRAGVALAALLCGCGGPSTADVAGTVTVRGQAPNLPGLRINFLGTDGHAVSAPVAPDGAFRATGLPVGEVRVGFSVLRDGPPPEETDGLSKPRPGESVEDFQKRSADPRTAVAIAKRDSESRAKKAAPGPVPESYRDPLKSGVRSTLKAGPGNTLDVDIK